jgi:hypothetical protein
VDHALLVVMNAFSALGIRTVVIAQAKPAIMKPARVSPAARKILATQEEWSATSIQAFVSKHHALKIVIAPLTSEKNAGFTRAEISKNTDV